MDEWMKWVKAGAVAVCTALASWLGVLALPLLLLIICNVADYITGLIAAPKRGEVRNSDRGFGGIAKKICMWLLVGAGVVLDVLLKYLAQGLSWELPFTYAVGCLVAVWLLANELLSIVENISDIGVPVPPFLLPVVRWVKGKAEEQVKLPESEDSTKTE